jgi:chromosomal replication initiation ATPase DnaA
MSEVIISPTELAQQLCKELEVRLTEVLGQPTIVLYESVSWVSISKLKDTIVDVCEIPWSEIIGLSRRRDVSLARHLFCYFAHTVLKMALSRIGTEINRDHTSVIVGRNNIRNAKFTKDDWVMCKYFEIQKRLTAFK